MKLKHYAVFKSSMKTLDWESLRNDESDASYFLPYSREDYLAKADKIPVSETTGIIADKIKALGIKKVFSIGCGIAVQEYQIKKESGSSVTVSDYNPAVLRLKQFGIFDECVQLDALRDTFPVNEGYLMLFPRIDTEFEDEQLRTLFAKCHKARVRHICFIPAQLLSFNVVTAELKTIILSVIRRKPRVFCGYSRSKNEFQKLWGTHYDLSDELGGDKKIFFLQTKTNNK